MNPLPQDYLTELTTREIIALATARFEQLRALDSDEPARQELLGSGVSAHRVRALYPFDFANIAAKVQPLVGRGELSQILGVNSPKLVRLTYLLSELTMSMDNELKLQLDEQSKRAANEAVAEFKNHVRALLPVAKPELEVITGLMCFIMEHSIALMEHIEMIEAVSKFAAFRRRSSAEMLLRVTDLLLPHMRAEEAAKAEIERYFAHLGTPVVF